MYNSSPIPNKQVTEVKTMIIQNFIHHNEVSSNQPAFNGINSTGKDPDDMTNPETQQSSSSTFSVHLPS